MILDLLLEKYISLKCTYIWSTPFNSYLLFYKIGSDSSFTDKLSVRIPGGLNNIFPLLNGKYKIKFILDTAGNSHHLKLYLISLLNFLIQEELVNITDDNNIVDYSLLGNVNYFIPIHAAIEITTRCNFDCYYCYNANIQKRDINYDDLIVFMNNIRADGIKVCQLTGGEPFIFPRIGILLDQIHEYFDHVVINTNGFFISDSILDIIEKYKNTISVQISLDCASNDNSLQDRKEKPKIILENISRIISAGIHASISSTIDPGHEEDLKELIHKCKKIGINHFTLSECGPWGRSEIRSNMIAIEPDVESNYYTYTNANEFLGQEHNCGAGWKGIAVKSSGDIVPCLTFNKSVVIGNINHFKGWKYYDLNKFYFVDAPRKDLCNKCKYVHKCSGCISKPLEIKQECRAYNNYYKYYFSI